jgi:DNA-binding IclR family transcriptional regulator
MSKIENLTSLEKALKILTLFSFFRPSMDVNEISKELGFPKSTVYRLSRVLLKYGLLEQDTERRGYRLGIKLFQMGSIVQYQRRIRDIAYPVMEELRNLTGETVVLPVITNDGILVLRQVEGRHPIRAAFEEGRVLPYHAGASSKVLLAYLSAEEQDQIIQRGLTRFTENTITEAVALKKELAQIRGNEYAYSDQEVDLAARAISAPIRDHSGKVIAAMTLLGPAHRFNEQTVRKSIPLIKEYAAKISQMMGFGLITPLKEKTY